MLDNAKQELPDGDYNLTIRRQVQNRHIQGTIENKQYAERLALLGLRPSVLASDVNVAEIVRKFHKKGIYDPNKKDNSPREKAHIGKFIGWYWDVELQQMIATEWIKIVYSNKGAHIYPIKPND